MKAIGIIQITDDLTLNNPSLEVKQVIYDWIENKCKIEILFKEDNSSLTHSRTFEFDIDQNKEYTTTDNINMIKNHPTLNKFN